MAFSVVFACLTFPVSAVAQVVVTGSAPLSVPEVGTINDVSVGEQMLSQQTASKLKGIQFDQPFAIKGVFSFTAGFYLATVEDDKYVYLEATENDPRPGYGSVLPKKVFGIDVAQGNTKFKVRRDVQKVCFGGNCSDAQYTESNRVVVTASTFQQTLIYNGGSGGKIRISYREFKDDWSRPAFTNDIEYDLGQSKLVAYKHAKLEILEADNTHIKYRVVSNFN